MGLFLQCFCKARGCFALFLSKEVDVTELHYFTICVEMSYITQILSILYNPLTL